MGKSAGVWRQADRRGPGGAGLVAGEAGTRLDAWQAVLSERHPDLLAHLVWDRERLDKLHRAVEAVLRDDGQVPAAMLPVYQRSLVNRLTGLGPLDAVLMDDAVTEIMVNGTEGFCEVKGRIVPRPLDFVDLEEVSLLAQRLANRAGRELNTEHPLCDAQLADGSRIHCVLPPVAERPTITIRRALRSPLQLADFVRLGTVSEALWEDLAAWVGQRRNIVVAGGAGSGKTSLLRLLATAIEDSERLITIEDVRELNLSHPHVVSLEAHRPHSVHTLLINALRMRPDRIIVGEVRGGEALDLIEAMSTGHPGSLSTVHSQSGDMRTIYRLARMCLHGQAAIPFDAMVAQIEETVDLIVYMRRGPDGIRRVESVNRVSPRGVDPVWLFDTAEGFVRIGEFR